MVEEEKSEIDKVQEQINDLLLLKVDIKEIQLNPVDYDRLIRQLRNRVSPETSKSFAYLMGVRIIENEEVPLSKMYVVKNSLPDTEHSAQDTEPNES